MPRQHHANADLQEQRHALPAATGGGYPWMPVLGFCPLAALVISLMSGSWLGRAGGTEDRPMEAAKAVVASHEAETEATAPVQGGEPSESQSDAPRTTEPSQASHFKNSIGMEMVWVDPLKLWVGKYEVTQAEYQAITGSNPSLYKGARRPVTGVSWNDAVSFISRLNKREQSKLPKGFAYRLPFDAEYDVYVGDASLNDAITRRGNIQGRTATVGSLKANNFGLHDTRGNVWEWMNDWYSAAIHQKNTYLHKNSSSIGQSYKVLRGGGASDIESSWYLAVTCRLKNTPDARGRAHYGFRVVLGPPDIALSPSASESLNPSYPRSGSKFFPKNAGY